MDRDRTDIDMSENTGTTRRRLLSAATGAFSLAASGLFLPEGLEEAEAREGALGGKLGGRHGHNRRGRNTRKRRKHGGKKDKGSDNRPPGASPIKFVAIRASGTPETNVRFYFRTVDWRGRWSNLKLGKFGQIPDYGSNLDYAPKMYSAAVYYYSDRLPYPVLIEVRNPLLGYPWAEVTWGCDIDGQGNVVGGSTYRRDGESEIPMDGDTGIHFETGLGNPKGNSSITVGRLNDSDAHKWFATRVSRI